MTNADMIILREALHNEKSAHRQRRLDSGMNMRYLLKKYGKVVVDEAIRALGADNAL